MSEKFPVLRTVTDQFDLFNDGRTIGANKRKYIIKSVQEAIASHKTKELLRLGEAYGYYGHGRRELAGKSILTEQTVVTIKGQPMVIDNVPSCRCIDISCSDDGIVEHTEEIAKTPTGLIIDSMIESKMGGWSWAMSGHETSRGSHARHFAGFDYVLNPNYLSLKHESMMLESISDRDCHISGRLLQAGFDDNCIKEIIQVGDKAYSNDLVQDLESQILLLEGMLNEKNKIESELQSMHKANATMLYESLSRLPIFIPDDVQSALCRLETDEDRNKVEMMLESLCKVNIDNLPIGKQANHRVISAKEQHGKQHHAINYAKKRLFT